MSHNDDITAMLRNDSGSGLANYSCSSHQHEADGSYSATSSAMVSPEILTSFIVNTPEIPFSRVDDENFRDYFNFNIPEVEYEGVLAQSWSPCTDGQLIGNYLENMRLPLSYRTLAYRWEQLGKPHLKNLRMPLNLLVSNNPFASTSSENVRKKDLSSIAQMQESAMVKTISNFLENGEHANKLFVAFASHLDIYCVVDTELTAMEQGLNVEEQTGLCERTYKQLLQDFELDRAVCASRGNHNCMASAIWGEVLDWPIGETHRRFEAYKKRVAIAPKEPKGDDQARLAPHSNRGAAYIKGTSSGPSELNFHKPKSSYLTSDPDQLLASGHDLVRHNIPSQEPTRREMYEDNSTSNSSVESPCSPQTPWTEQEEAINAAYAVTVKKKHNSFPYTLGLRQTNSMLGTLRGSETRFPPKTRQRSATIESLRPRNNLEILQLQHLGKRDKINKWKNDRGSSVISPLITTYNSPSPSRDYFAQGEDFFYGENSRYSSTRNAEAVERDLVPLSSDLSEERALALRLTSISQLHERRLQLMRYRSLLEKAASHLNAAAQTLHVENLCLDWTEEKDWPNVTLANHSNRARLM